jgi:hypothetical protein
LAGSQSSLAAAHLIGRETLHRQPRRLKHYLRRFKPPAAIRGSAGQQCRPVSRSPARGRQPWLPAAEAQVRRMGWGPPGALGSVPVDSSRDRRGPRCPARSGPPGLLQVHDCGGPSARTPRHSRRCSVRPRRLPHG